MPHRHSQTKIRPHSELELSSTCIFAAHLTLIANARVSKAPSRRSILISGLGLCSGFAKESRGLSGTGIACLPSFRGPDAMPDIILSGADRGSPARLEALSASLGAANPARQSWHV